MLTGGNRVTGVQNLGPGMGGSSLPSVTQVPGIPAWQATALEQMAQNNQLSGVPPFVLGLIALAESGFEKAGAGVNSSGYGGYFGLSTGSVASSTLLTNSQASFEAQAPVAAAIYAAGLAKSGGNFVGAENYYQTGGTERNSTSVKNNGAKLFANFLLGHGQGQQDSAQTTAPNTASSSGCAFGIGPMCILSQAGLNRFYGALLITAGGVVLVVGLGLVVVGALAETKLGRTASKTFGAAGLGTVVGAAAAPARAVSSGQKTRAVAADTAQRQTATDTHQRALRTAQLRQARARARRQEEGVRTQRAMTQGRDDQAGIRSYERSEGAQRRRTAVESRRAGRATAASNSRAVARRQKFRDVFGEDAA